MFRPTRPFKNTITGHKEEPSLRIGKKVPKDAVNLAYYYNPTATDAEKIMAADPPRGTIDHRVVIFEKVVLDQVGSASGGPPTDLEACGLPPVIHNYTDEDGYSGNIYRQDDTIVWSGEDHPDEKAKSDDKDFYVAKKGDEEKIIEYADANGYRGNLYLDSVNYEVYKTKDTTEEITLDYSVNNFELRYSEIFGRYLTYEDIVNGPFLNEPNAIGGENYCWPARIEVSANKLLSSDAGIIGHNDTNNTIANWINKQSNNFPGVNDKTVESEDIIYTSKPTGILYFDHFDDKGKGDGYFPVNHTDKQAQDGHKIEGFIGDVNSDRFPWRVVGDRVEKTDETYVNVIPTLDDVTINGQHIKGKYESIIGENYTEIEEFLTLAKNFNNVNDYAISKIKEGIENGHDIAIALDTLVFHVEDLDDNSIADINMLVDENNKGITGQDEENIGDENIIDTSLDPSYCYFIVSYKYIITDRGSEPTQLYDIIAVYHTITLPDGTCSMKRRLVSKKEEADGYIAHCHYTGIVDKNWKDWDGKAVYKGVLKRGDAIGNQNADGDNEILMFPDEFGYLRKIVEGIEIYKDIDGNEQYETVYKNYYKIEADTIYLTDVFKDGQACFYKHRLKNTIYDYRGPDDDGFYHGDAIQVYMNNMYSLPENYKHNIKLIPAEMETVQIKDAFGNIDEEEVPKCYFAELYTSFISSSSDTFKAIYNGFKNIGDDNKVVESGIEEDIYNYPFMINGFDYQIQNLDRKTRTSRIQILNYEPIPDNRKRIGFTWRVVAKDIKTERIYYSEERYSSILNKDYVLPCEYSNFQDRGMIISPKFEGSTTYASPRDICMYDESNEQTAWIKARHQELLENDMENGDTLEETTEEDEFKLVLTSNDKSFVFSVEIIDIAEPGSVNIKCNPDGSGVITAETTLDTGFYNEVRGTYTTKLDIQNPYWTDGKYIYKGYKVKCIDSRNIKVKAPREEKLLDSWYPLIQFGHYTRVVGQYGVRKKVSYTMPEYDSQHYSETYGQPYVEKWKEKVSVINPHMVKTLCYPLYLIDPRINKEDTYFIDNKLYKVIQEDFVSSVSWNEGEAICKRTGGHFPMPKSTKDIQSIISLMKKCDINTIWLGIKQNPVDLTWEYADGTELIFLDVEELKTEDNTNEDQYLQIHIPTENENIDEEYVLDIVREDEVGPIEKVICELTNTIKVYKRVEDEIFELHIKNVSFSDGVIILEEAVSETDDIVADYVYLEECYQYRGFWRDETDFVRIDLNPNTYHTYNDPNFLPSEVSPSKNLFNKIIYFFMKPSGKYEMPADMQDLYYNPNKTVRIPETKRRTVTKTRKTEGTRLGGVKDKYYIDEIPSKLESYSEEDKDILDFMLAKSFVNNYNGSIKITCNCSFIKHMILLESDARYIENQEDYENDENWKEIGSTGKVGNEYTNVGLHNRDQQTFVISNIKLSHDKFYKIKVRECEDCHEQYPDQRFAYTFSADTDILELDVWKSFTEETYEYDEEYEDEEEYTEYHEEFVEDQVTVISENDICLYHKIDDSEPDSDEDMMVGSVYIRADTSLHSTIVTDSRTRGGGILKEIKDKLRKELEPESDYYLDIGYYDGEPYQENGVIIVRLDNKLLKDFGGQFEIGDIEQKVNRWVAAGIYPIIEFVDTYDKRELPQYTLEVDSSYGNIIDIIPEIYIDNVDNTNNIHINPDIDPSSGGEPSHSPTDPGYQIIDDEVVINELSDRNNEPEIEETVEQEINNNLTQNEEDISFSEDSIDPSFTVDEDETELEEIPEEEPEKENEEG